MTGYIARDDKGRSITLGRNGSDFSATILGALVEAADVTIWTDVNAIYSTDPRKVSSAVPYRQVSWQQACQLAQLGNPVLHARTLAPLTGTDTVLQVRSSYEPAQGGCCVAQPGITQPGAAQQGFITELNDVTLLTLHQDTAVTAQRLALELQQPVIALPQQGDNLCWLLPAACAEQALAWLECGVREAPAMTSPQAVRDYLRLRLGDRPHEVFAVVHLDAQNRVVDYVEMFRGTVSQTSVYPREVVRDALLRNSCALVLVHNHPSGAARPSRADEYLTQTLKQAAALVDVRVLDHFIVAGDSVNSMAELGMV